MKRRATAILLGIMVSSMFLSACGKNEAKEAANESAQVEEEGVGEVTEEGEKVEAENKNASDADDSSRKYRVPSTCAGNLQQIMPTMAKILIFTSTM